MSDMFRHYDLDSCDSRFDEKSQCIHLLLVTDWLLFPNRGQPLDDNVSADKLKTNRSLNWPLYNVSCLLFYV